MRPLYLVDGFNFLHAVVLKGRDRGKWWTPANQARVVNALAPLAVGAEPLDIWVVFDRRRAPVGVDRDSESAPPARGGIEIHHAVDADAYIVARCAELAGRREVVVVSADRSLRDRARNHGARGLSPWAFASYPAGAGASGDPGTAPAR
jgi:YacP-like NYN domain